jgi:hypothetical protein
MKRFLDASILVEACLAQSPQFAAADALVKTTGAVTSAHALAEAYATLSGDARLKINLMTHREWWETWRTLYRFMRSQPSLMLS